MRVQLHKLISPGHRGGLGMRMEQMSRHLILNLIPPHAPGPRLGGDRQSANGAFHGEAKGPIAPAPTPRARRAGPGGNCQPNNIYPRRVYYSTLHPRSY